MVLCKFFEQGACRFGSKCVNEHINIKQQIKTDVETAINGKQWPISTYGPFKDKPSIPNFVEDQSFEEIRLLCYEAKQKNYFYRFNQEFSKEVVEATNKMKALLQMTPDIIDVLIRVYDTPSDTTCSGVSTNKITNNANNPFGLMNSANANSGLNLFPTLTQQKEPVSTGAGLFLQQNQFLPQSHQSSNIFKQAAQPQQGLFAQASQTIQQQQFKPKRGFAQPETIADTGMFAQVPQPAQNIFCQPIQQQQQTNSNIFQHNISNSGSSQHQVNSNIFNQTQCTEPQQQIQQPVTFFSQTSVPTQSSAYSRLEDLTAEEIEAFKADCFQLGKLPFNPPPRELIN